MKPLHEEQNVGESLPASIVLFDGECSFCNRSIQFIIRHDPGKRFQFASLHAPVAQQQLLQAGVRREHLPDSIVLLEQDRVYTKSTAALRIARRLSGLWPLAYVFLLVPPLLRDAVYDLVARNRYRWFGRQQTCLLPTPEIRERFLSE
jgi:predicted DCC family thiol-disulfide oxidoreductase YuxK